jgi:hypothetical protein
VKPRLFPLPLLVLTLLAFSAVSQGQTNSWIISTDGFWDEARFWSLAEPPSIAQSAILITNAASETVTIDSITANSFTSTLTISNLSVSAPSGSINTLSLDNTGTIALHILNGLTIGIDPDTPAGAGGMELTSTNSTLIVDGLQGGQLEDNGTMLITGGSLITTNCSLTVGGFFDNAIGFLLISNAVVQARDVIIAWGDNSSGMIEIIGGTMTLSSSLTVGDGDSFLGYSQGSLLVANGALLVVTNGDTGIAVGNQDGGTMTVSNATFLAANIFLGGDMNGGELTINNGTVTLSGVLVDGGGGQSGFGDVSLNGGLFVVTNDVTIIGADNDHGILTISDGIFLGQTVLVGTGFASEGILSIQGGISVLSSNLQIGDDLSDAIVSITGGQLFVTNGVISVSDYDDGAQIEIFGGQLAAKTIVLGGLAGGTLVVDGGSVTVSTGITMGDCNDSFVVGYASVDGGQLTVTNAAGTGFIDVQNGQLILGNGVLRVNKLVMTNSCSSLIHTGGTLIVGSVILDPNAFRITTVAREGNNLRVTWLMGPGQINALQATTGGTGGSYTTNGFTDIFIVTNNTTPGTLTNYLDVGAATNFPSRYYRARLAL